MEPLGESQRVLPTSGLVEDAVAGKHGRADLVADVVGGVAG